jgi:hypothetical protein
MKINMKNLFKYLFILLKWIVPYIVAPVVLLRIISITDVYDSYPYVSALSSYLMLLIFILPLFLVHTIKIRGALVLYIIEIIITLIVMPVDKYEIVFTPRNIGRRIGRDVAYTWDKKGHYGLLSQSGEYYEYNLKKVTYEKIGNDAIVFSYADPPVFLLIAAKQDRPYCSGYPPSAVQACNAALEPPIKREIKSP